MIINKIFPEFSFFANNRHENKPFVLAVHEPLLEHSKSFVGQISNSAFSVVGVNQSQFAFREVYPIPGKFENLPGSHTAVQGKQGDVVGILRLDLEGSQKDGCLLSGQKP